MKLKTTEEFINDSKKIHGNKYDYSKVVYKGSKTKVCIICPIHGEFWQKPNNHLCGGGCRKCSYEGGRNTNRTLNGFIKTSKKIHGDRYDYSKVEYKNNKTKVCIICPKHGEFWQRPDNHIHGQGCPYCKLSKLEIDIFKWLTLNSIEFVAQKKFNWLKSKRNYLRLDFYLPKFKIAIECQGIQHYRLVDYGGRGAEFSEKTFEDTLKWDKIKKDLCLKHGIKILYYSKKDIKEFSKDYELITDKRLILKELKKYEYKNFVDSGPTI